MTYLIAAVAVWAAGLVVLPVTIWRDDLRANGLNRPILIVMRRELRCPGAVWAQEYYEARVRWLYLPMQIAFLVGRMWPRLAFWERWLEIRGHAVEVAAEERLTETDRRDLIEHEAVVLMRYRAFRGWTGVEIERALRWEMHSAVAWVERHWDAIREKHMEGGA